MSDTTMNRVEELRQSALAHVRAGEIDEALAMFDSALAIASDDEARELITINKADAMIATDRQGPEVQALPAIVMRRRNPRNVYLAAYALVFKYRTETELKRAAFYGQLALQTAEEAGEPVWTALALNELASIYDMDSQFALAIECGVKAVALLEQFGASQEYRYALALENLGASRLLNDEYPEGVALIERALPMITAPSHRAEACIDLCYGYIGLDNLDRARFFGEAGLEVASEARQVRNAHYLLGEVAYKSEDIELAEYHFEQLSKFYPDFRHLKTLLYAFDLRSMVNLKL